MNWSSFAGVSVLVFFSSNQQIEINIGLRIVPPTSNTRSIYASILFLKQATRDAFTLPYLSSKKQHETQIDFRTFPGRNNTRLKYISLLFLKQAARDPFTLPYFSSNPCSLSYFFSNKEHKTFIYLRTFSFYSKIWIW